MKRFVLLSLIGCSVLTATAQVTVNDAVQRNLEETKMRLEDFNRERMLDSLDQEQLPKIVSGGLFGGGNVSNFIITRAHRPMSSHMRIGAEIGGFMDFTITQHFAIQPQIILTAHQNYFAQGDTTNHLWSFGIEIPVFFLGRFGNMQKGYIQFGGGVFTHFTYLSNVQGRYQNVDRSSVEITPLPQRVVAEEDEYDYSHLYALHDNHFGACVMVGYEFSFGMQINATYKISLSDIAGFYRAMKGQPVADALIYPQSVSLNIGYRWK